MPYNPTTGKAYRGGNVIGLMLAAMKNQFPDPRWLTYKQAESNGWQVRRGERGIPYNLEENAAYISGWLDALRKDKNEIFRAARDAHKAADFLLALELNKSLEEAIAAANGKPQIETSEPTGVSAAETAVDEAARSPYIPRGFRPAISASGSDGMDM